jgi:hypothetical protein
MEQDIEVVQKVETEENIRQKVVKVKPNEGGDFERPDFRGRGRFGESRGG